MKFLIEVRNAGGAALELGAAYRKWTRPKTQPEA